VTAFTGEVHPFADWYPMLPDQELRELADDIAANGLLRPITLSPEGVLLDGRNRLAACRLAGVEPVFDVAGSDPFGVIRSANNRRRKMTAGMVAITDAVAMRAQGLWDDQAGRWKYGSGNFAKQKSGASLVAMAGAILAHSEDRAREVVAGTLSLRAAYDMVQVEKAEAAARHARHQELTTRAPDLAARVDDDFTFDMAYAAYQERDKERLAAEQRERDTRNDYLKFFAYHLAGIAGHNCSPERAAYFDALIEHLDTDSTDPTAIDNAITVLTKIKERTCSTNPDSAPTTSSHGSPKRTPRRKATAV
jgi:hypothetical protein